MQNCKSIVTMGFECYLFNHAAPALYRYDLHYNEMIMSVLQEVRVYLTKKLYRKTISVPNFRLNVYTVYTATVIEL